MEKLGINTKNFKKWQIERLEVFKKILNKEKSNNSKEINEDEEIDKKKEFDITDNL